MYVIPLAILILIALVAVAWSPIFALIVAVPLFVAFLAYVGMSRRADEKIEPPTGTSDRSAGSSESDREKGIWGERRAQ